MNHCAFWSVPWKSLDVHPCSLSYRQADGRKVLRSSIREFLCSEAVFALGIPTTRAGSLVTSDSKVVRDVFYSGNPRMERCSVVLRIAPTFIRSVALFLCGSCVSLYVTLSLYVSFTFKINNCSTIEQSLSLCVCVYLCVGLVPLKYSSRKMSTLVDRALVTVLILFAPRC